MMPDSATITDIGQHWILIFFSAYTQCLIFYLRQNLKKSWHPQTMKNIERVWKAEQKYEAERKKIEELQKELKEERSREEMTRYAEETGAIKLVLWYSQLFVWVETKK